MTEAVGLVLGVPGANWYPWPAKLKNEVRASCPQAHWPEGQALLRRHCTLNPPRSMPASMSQAIAWSTLHSDDTSQTKSRPKAAFSIQS
jgi:hypothetical protein